LKPTVIHDDDDDEEEEEEEEEDEEEEEEKYYCISTKFVQAWIFGGNERPGAENQNQFTHTIYQFSELFRKR
jgi:hypothetical protein